MVIFEASSEVAIQASQPMGWRRRQRTGNPLPRCEPLGPKAAGTEGAQKAHGTREDACSSASAQRGHLRSPEGCDKPHVHSASSYTSLCWCLCDSIGGSTPSLPCFFSDEGDAPKPMTHHCGALWTAETKMVKCGTTEWTAFRFHQYTEDC